MSNTIYIPKYFDIKELVPPVVYNNASDKFKLWWIFDDRLLKTADMLRDRYGAMYVNKWSAGLRECGYRLPDSQTGRELSQHKYGRALDLHPMKTTAEKIREDIQAEPWAEEFKYITCIELGVTWLHIDTRNYNKEEHGIFLVTG